jgi:signal transduction histidine kinase
MQTSALADRVQTGGDSRVPTGVLASALEPAVGEILAVDDSLANLLAIEAALGEFGAHVVKTQSGADALRRLLTQDFALILLDVQMPIMDGFQTARMIRDRQRNRETPIIFVTAHQREHADVLKAYELGAVDFLFKPIVPEILRAKASVLLALQRRTAEVAIQARLLREHEHQEHQRKLSEARRDWEDEMLRRQMEEERRVATETARRAEELAHTVSTLEKVERELTRSNQDLAEADRRKDEFLAVLAHELRNPLAPLSAGLEVLRIELEPLAVSPLITSTRTSMERQVRHLRRLVDELLDTSRIESGKVTLDIETVDLRDVVSQALGICRAEIEERRQTLTVNLPDDPVWVNGDSVRLTQVLANLLNNANRYTDVGGHIRLDCTTTDQTGQAMLAVTDDGQGISPEVIARVFDIFVQERSGAGGLGIGLTLVRQLVELHRGEVTVQSAGLGLGSRFEVKLPLAPVDDYPLDCPAKTDPPPDFERPTERNLRVVVVDDSEDIRETMCALLSLWGHDVQTAGDGRAGLDLILEQEPDVAVVDIGLPELDGLEVARAVRASPLGKGVRLVAMTGFGQKQDRIRVVQAGFDTHLVKPARAEELEKALLGSDAAAAPQGEGAPPATADPGPV